MDGIPTAGRIVLRILVRPRLWPIALTEVLVLARPGWWRHWPPLPRPDAAYLRFRLHTAYGDGRGTVEPGDVVDYLEWCRRMRQIGRR